MAVKEGSTFILDSLERVEENEDEGIEARDEVKLTAGKMDVFGTAIVADNGNSIAATTVKDGGILDLGYNTFSSNVTMDAGSTLNIGVKNAEETETGELTHGKIEGDFAVNDPKDEGTANASMNLVIAADTKLGEGSKIEVASGDGLGKLVVNNNLLYNLDGLNKDGTIDTSKGLTVSKKDSSEVAAGVAANGANGNQAGTIAAFVDGLSGNARQTTLPIRFQHWYKAVMSRVQPVGERSCACSRSGSTVSGNRNHQSGVWRGCYPPFRRFRIFGSRRQIVWGQRLRTCRHVGTGLV